MQTFRTFLFLCFMVLGVIVVVRWQYAQADKIVNRWAQANGFELVSAQMCGLQTGPFVVYARGQFVFRIVVIDRSGRQRSGWILVGSWHSGVLSDETKVKWDE
jgi:hypothetical protein